LLQVVVLVSFEKRIKNYLLEIFEDEIYREENKAAVMWWQPEN
jgi:hypothetical protein